MGEVQEYLEGLPGDRRDAASRVYTRARALVPEAEEGTSYGMPALRYRGKALLAVMSAKDHIGLFPFSPPALDTVRTELGAFSTSKGTVRFTPEHPLPDDLVDRIVLARRDEIDAAVDRKR